MISNNIFHQKLLKPKTPKYQNSLDCKMNKAKAYKALIPTDGHLINNRNMP